MIDIKECLKRYKTNPFLLKRSIDFELSKHGKEVCVCTSSFTQFFGRKRTWQGSNHNKRTIGAEKGIINKRTHWVLLYI